MLADLALTLRTEDNSVLRYALSSNLQGVMMENIESDYAEILHHSPRNPYSICLIQGAEPCWHIRTTTEEAYEKIIQPLMKPGFDGFEIRDKKMKVEIVSKSIESITRRSLMDEFASKPCGKNFDMVFQTPTSFKRQGRYWILPDSRLILQSLMNKYTASAAADMYDEETLNQLTEACEPARFDIRSITFPLEGVWVPAFIGKLGIRVFGNETMARYIRLLLHFGQYSGVGIKTGIGMGAIEWREEMKNA